MLTSTELHRLVQELADTKVLSVYLDSRETDPAKRNAWKPRLEAGLREARASLTSEEDRRDFDRAAALLEEASPQPGGVWGAPGWVAFVSAETVHHAANLPVEPPPLVAWRDGPVVSPYLRALKQQRPVIAALVESRSARLYCYAMRKVETLDELTAPTDEAPGAERITGPAARAAAAAVPAARGAVGTDEAQRRRRSVFQRLATSLADRITQLAGDDAWILIGGTEEWAHMAAAALPRNLAKRTLVSTAIEHGASTEDIAQAAKRAASELRAQEGLRLVEQVLEGSGGGGRAAADIPGVQRALHANAVDVLLLSPNFIRTHETNAEDMVRAALSMGADVEVLSGKAAEKLDQTSSGIGARLRFPIDEPVKAVQVD